MIGALFGLLKRQTDGEQFLNMPVVVVAWLYLATQFYLSYREMILYFLPYMTEFVINLVVALTFTVLIVILGAAGKRTEKNEQKIAQKVLFVKKLKNDLTMIEASDSTLKKKIDGLIEEVAYCDPMSHSHLSGIEELISEKVWELSKSEKDTEKSLELCDEIAKLLKKRANECASLKGVKDEADMENTEGGGIKTAAIGIGVAYAIVMITLAMVFYIVPETKYKDACELMAAEKYDSAIKAFLEIKDYKDSSQKIEEINIAKLDIEYDTALQLMQDEKYEEAMAAFEALNGYRDSREKMEEIKEIALEKIYARAEQAFNDGDYETALGLYRVVAPYKESNEKIVDINNRLSSDKIVYLGTYKGEPVAWRIVERYGFNKMLLLADQPIRELPISDDKTHTSFKDSQIAQWLNGEFIADFSEEDLSQIIPTEGLNVFILSEEDVERLTEMEADLSAKEDWWLRSESDTGFKYATAAGTVEDAGDLHFRDKGVRPAVWIDLK